MSEGCLLIEVGTKPLSEPILDECDLTPWRLQNGEHFVWFQYVTKLLMLETAFSVLFGQTTLVDAMAPYDARASTGMVLTDRVGNM